MLKFKLPYERSSTIRGNQYEANDSRSGTGHLAVEFRLGNKTVYLSFYPTDFNGKAPLQLVLGPKDDTGKLQTKSADEKELKPEVFSIDKIDFKAVTEYVENLRKDPGKWSLSRDCADLVAEALQAGGLQVNNTQKSNSTVKGTADLLKNAGAQPRAYNQGVTWQSNYKGGVPDY